MPLVRLSTARPSGHVPGRGRRWLFASVAVAMAVFVGFSGCALPRSGTLGQDCTADAACDDANPCTVDTCDDSGVCVVTVDDQVTPPQVGGDCARVECEEGEPVGVADDTDFEDDDEPCTVDACDGGATTHAPLEDGASCDVAGNAGSCKGGACQVECTASNAAETCDDQNGCTTDTCNLGAGLCEHAPLDNVVPDDAQTAGDCKAVLCLTGAETVVADNADLPDDANPCTANVCTEGTPTNPHEALGFGCSDAGNLLATVCDDAGACVECNAPADCGHLPADDDCQTRTCVANTCGQTFTAVDTALGAQTGGDCKVLVCDGSGGSKINVDDADLPDDANACTKNLCANGVASNPNEPFNAPCGVGGTLFCNGAGACFGCTADVHCDADTFCKNNFCDIVIGTCKFNSTANNTPLPVGDQTVGDCKEVQCNGAGNTKVVNRNQDVPADDGKECTSETCTNGTPQHPNKALNTACGVGGTKYCDGGGACVDCNAVNQCPAAADCKSAACLNKACTTTNDAMGSLADVQVAQDCKSKICDGAGNVAMMATPNNADIKPDANSCTTDTCSMGTPVYTTKAVNTACTDPNYAPGKFCDGGIVGNGSPKCVECTMDNQCMLPKVCKESTQVCCTPTTCAGLGKTCGVHADTCDGNVACSGMKNGAETDTDCGGDVNACATRCDNGKACLANSDCANNFCVDGVCCDSACGGGCDACNLPGKVGMCSPRADGAVGVPVCTGGYFCDGALGACPTSCATAADCSSGVCKGKTCQEALCGDGVKNGLEACDFMDPATPCCSAMCAGAAAAGTVCGTDPDAMGCMAAPECNGMGTNAMSCTAAVEPNDTACTSDNVFCNGAEKCAAGACVPSGVDPCAGNVGDADQNCSESCNENADDCTANDPANSVCGAAQNKICDGAGNCSN